MLVYTHTHTCVCTHMHTHVHGGASDFTAPYEHWTLVMDPLKAIRVKKSFSVPVESVHEELVVLAIVLGPVRQKWHAPC